MPTVNSITLNDFAQMVRMSAEGKFATSIDKTTGGIYVDDKGNVKNVRGKVAQKKGDAAQNVILRQKLVEAFTRGHATADFLNVVRQRLGLKADNTALDKRAGMTLDRRDVKELLSAFAEGEYKVQQEGNAKVSSHQFDFKAETKTIGKNEWVEIADPTFEASRQKLVNGLSKRIMDVFIERPEEMFGLYEKMLEKSGIEGMRKDRPPTSEAEIKKFVAKIVDKNWHSNAILKTFLNGKMNDGVAELLNDAMHDHLYTVAGKDNGKYQKQSGLAWELFRVGNGAKLGVASVRDILTVNGQKYDHGNISPEAKAELEAVFPKPESGANMLGTPWERDGAYLPLAHALIKLLPPEFGDREKFLLFATNLMGYNGPSSIGANPMISERDNGYGRIVDLFMRQGNGPVLVGGNGGTAKRMDLSVVNDEKGNPKSLVLKQEYGIGPALTNFFGCDVKLKDSVFHCVEMGRFETTVTIDLTRGLDENGKPHFTTTTVRLPDAQEPEAEDAPNQKDCIVGHEVFRIYEQRLQQKGYLSPAETDENGEAFIKTIEDRLSEDQKHHYGIIGRNFLAGVANRFRHRPDLLEGISRFDFTSVSLPKNLLQLDDDQVEFILNFIKPYNYSMSADLLASLIEHRSQIEALQRENPNEPIPPRRILQTLLPDASNEHIDAALKKNDLAKMYEDAISALGMHMIYDRKILPGEFLSYINSILKGDCRVADIRDMFDRHVIDASKLSKLEFLTPGVNNVCSIYDGRVEDFLASVCSDVFRLGHTVMMTGDDGKIEEMYKKSEDRHVAEFATARIFEKLMDNCRGRIVQAHALTALMRQDNLVMMQLLPLVSGKKDLQVAQKIMLERPTFTYGKPNEDGSIDVTWHSDFDGKPPSGDIVRRVMPDGSVKVLDINFTVKAE